MSYTAKRLILLVMAWSLLVFIGITVRINLKTPPLPVLTPTAPALAAGASVATAVPDRAAALQQILDQDPNNLPALLELAAIFYGQRDWASAITLYGRAQVLDVHNVDVLVHLAAAQLYALHFPEARDTLGQAAQLAPQRADIHLLLGLALSRQAPPDVAGARAEWQRVIALAPGTALAQQAQDLLNGAPGSQ